MAAKRLRVVTAADKLAKVKPPTLAAAIEGGDYLEILKAQRRQMVADLRGISGPALAALHRQIGLHSKEIAAIEDARKEEEQDGGEVEDGDFDATTV